MKNQLTQRIALSCILLIGCISAAHAQEVQLRSPFAWLERWVKDTAIPVDVSKIKIKNRAFNKSQKLLTKYQSSKDKKRTKLAGKLDKHLLKAITPSEQKAELLLATMASDDKKPSTKARKQLSELREQLLIISNAVILSPDVVDDVALRPHIMRLIALEVKLTKSMDHTKPSTDEKLK